MHLFDKRDGLVNDFSGRHPLPVATLVTHVLRYMSDGLPLIPFSYILSVLPQRR